MADYQAEFKRILDEEVRDYAARALGLLAQVIQAKGLVLSQELLNSLRTQVVVATAQHVATMGILFEQYGRIKDIKGLNRTKAAPIEELEKYVKKVGMSHFQYVPGYEYGQFPLASKTAITTLPGPRRPARPGPSEAQVLVQQNFLRQHQPLHQCRDQPLRGGHRHVPRRYA